MLYYKKKQQHISYFFFTLTIMLVVFNSCQFVVHDILQAIYISQDQFTETKIVVKNKSNLAAIQDAEIQIGQCWYDIVSFTETEENYHLIVVQDHHEEALKQHSKKQFHKPVSMQPLYYAQIIQDIQHKNIFAEAITHRSCYRCICHKIFLEVDFPPPNFA